MDAVIRLKDKRREIFKDAEKLFQKEEGKKRIEVWDLSGFQMEGVEKKIRYYASKKHGKKRGKKKPDDVGSGNTGDSRLPNYMGNDE